MSDARGWIPVRATAKTPGPPFNCVVGGTGPAGFALIAEADLAAHVALVRDAQWPAVRVSQGGGPTGRPWVDSNGWRIRIQQTLHPDKPVWVGERPEPQATAPQWALAVAEAETYGARWIAAEPNPEAARAVEFFERHKRWREYRPLGVVAVVSDFSGPNASLAGEVANLLGRRHLCYRLLRRGNLGGLDTFQAIVYVDREPIPAAITAWAKGGGVLIGPGFKADPYAIASGTHTKLGRKHDMLRLWNGGSMNAHYTGSSDGKTRLVQLLNYATREAANDVTLGLTARFKSARMHTFQWTKDLKPAADGELMLPPFSVYAAIEVEL